MGQRIRTELVCDSTEQNGKGNELSDYQMNLLNLIDEEGKKKNVESLVVGDIIVYQTTVVIDSTRYWSLWRGGKVVQCLENTILIEFPGGLQKTEVKTTMIVFYVPSFVWT